MERIKTIKVTCQTTKEISNIILDTLKNLGVEICNVQAGKSTVLREKDILFGAISKSILEDDPADIIYFFINPEQLDDVLNLIISKSKINIVGRGSIFCQEVEIIHNNIVNFNKNLNFEKSNEKFNLSKGLTGLTCIVQRGESVPLVQNILDMGFSVPIITYGIGTGLRDKLGLLRITIPAEKEVVNLVVADQDSQDVMNSLIETGKLYEPGKGFIYKYSLKKGIINTKIVRGKMKHAASIEQIINAIDELKGSYEWRQKDLGISKISSKIKFLNDLLFLNFICNEGKATDLTKSAMAAGAGGATIYKLKNNYLNNIPQNLTIINAREMSNLIIGKKSEENIVKSLIDSGIFNEDSSGWIEISPVHNACTYLG